MACTQLLVPQVPRTHKSYLAGCSQRFMQVAQYLGKSGGDFPTEADVDDIIMLDRALMSIIQLASLPSTEANPTEATNSAEVQAQQGAPSTEANPTEASSSTVVQQGTPTAPPGLSADSASQDPTAEASRTRQQRPHAQRSARSRAF